MRPDMLTTWTINEGIAMKRREFFLMCESTGVLEGP
jgi:hypothetical protein